MASFTIPSNHNRLYHFRLLHVVAAGVEDRLIADRPAVPAKIVCAQEMHSLWHYPYAVEEEEEVVEVEVRRTSCWSDPEVDDIDDRILRMDVESVAVASIVVANAVDDTSRDDIRMVVHETRRNM